MLKCLSNDKNTALTIYKYFLLYVTSSISAFAGSTVYIENVIISQYKEYNVIVM